MIRVLAPRRIVSHRIDGTDETELSVYLSIYLSIYLARRKTRRKARVCVCVCVCICVCRAGNISTSKVVAFED